MIGHVYHSLPIGTPMLDSGFNGCGLSEGLELVMDDNDWLTQEFREAEREYRALPETARPVVVPAADVADLSLPTPATHRAVRIASSEASSGSGAGRP